MRLFVAVDLGPRAEEAVARSIEQVRGLAPDAKWVRPEASHLTLAFLGQKPDDAVPAMEAALRGPAERHAALSLHLARGGTFGPSRRPRVLWLGLDGDLNALKALRADVEAVLGPYGYAPEQRDFSPHLTLARSRDPRGDAGLARAAEHLNQAAAVDVSVDAFTLFKSDLSPKGARYTALAKLALKGAAAS